MKQKYTATKNLYSAATKVFISTKNEQDLSKKVSLLSTGLGKYCEGKQHEMDAYIEASRIKDGNS